MTNDEKIRLVLETLGVDNVRQATRALREMAEATDSLEGEMDALRRSIADGVEQPMERFIVTLKDGRKVWNDSAEGLKHLGKTVGRDGDFGRRVLEASYMIDDIQYGMRGVVNNIPQFARTFNISTAAVGAFGIGAVAVNQALATLGPLFEETNKPAKEFSDLIGDLAKNTATGKLEAESLAKEVEKLSKSFSPGLFESVGATLDRMEKLIEKQSKVIEQNEKIRQQQADIKKVEDELKAASQDSRSELAGEFFAGQDAAGMEASIKAMMPEFMDQARRDLVQTELDKLISTGGIKTEWQKEFARADIAKRIRGDDVTARARELSMASVGAAQRGDKASIERMARMDPGFADFLAGDEADKAFQQDLSDRSRAIRNRDERKRKIEERTRQGLIDAGLQMGRPGGINDEILIQQGRAAKGGGPAGVIEDVAPAITPKSPEELAALAQEAEIRNQVLAQFDPAQMAAARNFEAGSGPWRNRNLQQLRDRDFEIFRNALEQNGMAPGAADTAARESLQGGENQFEQYARDIGVNLKNGTMAMRATEQYFQMIGSHVQEFAVQMNMLMQQMNMMNQTMSVRPMNGRARQ